jgi:putative ABC transport system permease protein
MILYHLRHAVRLLARERAFTMAALLTLALGVGANVAVFAVVEAVLLRPLPYEAADRLVILVHRDVRTGITKEFIAVGDHADLAARQSALERLSGYGTFRGSMLVNAEPVRIRGLMASPGLLETLRVKPVLGRTFTPDDGREGAAPVVMLGYSAWQTQFGADPNIVGRGVTIEGRERQVIGVAPRGFAFPPSSQTEAIIPQVLPAQAPTERKSGWTFAVGRLNANGSVEDATANVAAISRQLQQEFPRSNADSEYYVVPLRDALVGDTKRALSLLLGAVAVVLLIACANVANLLLARSVGRRQEMAVRTALGAGRSRLAAQLLAESFVLAVAAAVVGTAIAYWGAQAVVRLVPASVQVPGLDDVTINSGVLLFAVALSVLTAFVFGIVSTFTTRSQSAIGAFVSTVRVRPATRRTTASLVVAEVALAIVLLIGAGLILRTFSALLSVDPGFQPDGVVTMEVTVPAGRFTNADAALEFYRRAFTELKAKRNVSEVGAAVVVPLTGNNWTVGFERADRPLPAGERPPEVGWQLASGSYFRTMRIPLVSGRLFDDRDGPRGKPVVIVSEAIQRRFFPGGSAVGHAVKLGDTTMEIVGVVGNIRRAALTDEPRADMYFPFEHAPGNSITLFVRSTADPASVGRLVQATLRANEPGTIVEGMRTLSSIANESMQVTRLALWLLGIFAATALMLAAVGIYGVMSYAVRQRTREIGTRVALGATRGDIVWLVMRQGVGIAAAGMAIGLAAGLAAARSLSTILYGITPSDPATLVAAAFVLATTMMAACYLPARRAASVDPARTLAD